jgi:hypothetical protein
MKSVVQKSLHGCGPGNQGWKLKLGIAIVSAICLTSAFAPTRASAAPATPISHLQYIQAISQAVGESGQFNASSSAADYIQWAKNRGMNPASGWSANSPMVASAVAETLVQLLDLNPKKFGGDHFRNLDSQGIHIGASSVVTAGFLASLLDQPEASSQVGRLASLTLSPTKPGNGIGFGVGWYRHNGIVPPAVPPGPPPGAPRGGNRN